MVAHPHLKVGVRGKSELHRAGCSVMRSLFPLTPLFPPLVRGELKGGWGGRRKVPQKKYRPAPLWCGVRVKRRGKSSPLQWRHWRHGKPHPEQDQIGSAPLDGKNGPFNILSYAYDRKAERVRSQDPDSNIRTRGMIITPHLWGTELGLWTVRLFLFLVAVQGFEPRTLRI